MKTLRFYKTNNNEWFVDLPNYEGFQSDLQMIEGGDTLLDIISNNGIEAEISITDRPFHVCNKLKFIELNTEYNNGAFYFIEKYNKKEINLKIWLCDVTLLVLGTFPDEIYFY
jgi:hypothetical protein